MCIVGQSVFLTEIEVQNATLWEGFDLVCKAKYKKLPDFCFGSTSLLKVNNMSSKY